MCVFTFYVNVPIIIKCDHDTRSSYHIRNIFLLVCFLSAFLVQKIEALSTHWMLNATTFSGIHRKTSGAFTTHFYYTYTRYFLQPHQRRWHFSLQPYYFICSGSNYVPVCCSLYYFTAAVLSSIKFNLLKESVSVGSVKKQLELSVKNFPTV